MCFGRAIWLGRSLSRNTLQCYCSAIAYHCGFAAYRKPPLVNILASDYPIHQTVLLQKRRNSCDTRAHYLRCVVCSHGAAVLVRSVPVWCSGNCRNCARASCTSWCGDTRGLCAQQWFGLGDECTRLSFERRGAVLWTDPPASVCTSVANCCYLRAGCCRTVCMGWCKIEWQREMYSRLKAPDLAKLSVHIATFQNLTT